MCSRQECLKKLNDAFAHIQTEYGVRTMCLFGSVARGENHSESDVDLCVDMPPKAFQVIALKNYLRDLLGTDVDVVRRNVNLDDFLLNEIERDGIYIGA